MEAGDNIERLVEISAKKLVLADEILLFAARNHELVQAGRLEEVELPAEERAAAAEMDKLDEKFMIYASRLKSVLHIDTFEKLPLFNLPKLKELKNMVLKINERLAEIKRLEGENSVLMMGPLAKATKKSDCSDVFKRIPGAYSAIKTNPSSGLFDKKK